MAQLSSDHRRYVLIETLISTLANVAMALLSALPIVLGRSAVPVWNGATGIAFDLLVTAFVAPFMTTLVVTLLARRRLASGAIRALDRGQGGPLVCLPYNIVLRSLACAIACALVFASLGIAALAFSGAAVVPTAIFLAGKTAFTVMLIVLITPPLARAALCSRPAAA